MATTEVNVSVPQDVLRAAIAARVFEALGTEDKEAAVRMLVDSTLGSSVHRGSLGRPVPNEDHNIDLLHGLIEKLVIEHASELIKGELEAIKDQVAVRLRESFASSWQAAADKVAQELTEKAMKFALTGRSY